MSSGLVVSADRLIFDAHADPLVGGGIRAEMGVIVEIGESVSGEEERGRDLYFPGCSIMPGLIDCHLHLGIEGNAGDPEHRLEPDPVFALRMAKNAAIDLRAGVTACRDLGTKNQISIHLKDALSKGLFMGPRLYVSGRPLGAPEGHCNYMTVAVRDAPEAAAAVRQEIAAGADIIKLMVTGGLVPPSRGVQLAVDQVKAATEEAHRLGKRAAGHIESNEGAWVGVTAGLDSIEHGVEIEDTALEAMARQRSYLVPTLSAFYLVAKHGDDAGLDRTTTRKAVELWEFLQDTFARALGKQVPIAVGTDYWHGHIALELELMAQLGMENRDVLAAATKNGAELLGIRDHAGTLAVGKWADFVVVHGDPIDDLGSLRKVRMVALGGEIVYLSDQDEGR